MATETDVSPDGNGVVKEAPTLAVLPTSCVEVLEMVPDNVNSQVEISFGGWPRNSTIFQYPYGAPTNYIEQASNGLLILGIPRFRITHNTCLLYTSDAADE